MADMELLAAEPVALQAAQDVLADENEQVKALIVLLMGNDPAGGRELEELAGQVASMERRLDAALEELGEMRQKIQEVQDRSLKALLQKNCKALEGNQGILVNKKKVQRIMQKRNLQVTSFTRKSRKYSSYKGRVGTIAPNRIKRRFHTHIPHQKITTDTTEFK